MNKAQVWITYTLFMVICSLAVEYRALQQDKTGNQKHDRMSKLDYWAGFLKGLASFGFLAYFYEQNEPWVFNLSSLALGVALFASAIGDVLLVGKKEIYFLLGLIAFFVAHLAYAIAFLQPIWTLGIGLLSLLNICMVLVIILISFFAYRYFQPHMPKTLVYPALAYTSVIGLMMSIALIPAFVLQHYTVAMGAIAFWLSDLAVAKQQFQAEQLHKKGFYVRLWGLPLYYIAQIILASKLA